MLPGTKVILVGERPGGWTGDRIRHYSDSTVELVSCGDVPRKIPPPTREVELVSLVEPSRVPPNPWSTTPLVLEPPLIQNRAQKRAAKFKKKPGKRRL